MKKVHLFHQFAGAHSLLIGLIPFFLPALIWQQGLGLAKVSLFIAISGLGFAIALYFWDRLRRHLSLKSLLLLSFFFELLLVAAVVNDRMPALFYCTAILYGIYGCFYWMMQRYLFIESIGNNNSGKKFGNFQITVLLLLKAGMLTGGFVTEQWGAPTVLALSVSITVFASVYFYRQALPHKVMSSERSRTLSSLLRFKDGQRSRLIFFIDGLFLFAESFFWVITLYILANKNLAKLGLIVVLLSVVLSGAFVIIKNKIDRIPAQKVYLIAVVGYALSWLLRASVDPENETIWDYNIVVMIAFLTTLFRLVFNKRFFDIAQQNSPLHYIVTKSYWSQLGLALLFLCVALFFELAGDDYVGIHYFYLVLGAMALAYAVYKPVSRSL